MMGLRRQVLCQSVKVSYSCFGGNTVYACIYISLYKHMDVHVFLPALPPSHIVMKSRSGILVHLNTFLMWFMAASIISRMYVLDLWHQRAQKSAPPHDWFPVLNLLGLEIVDIIANQ